MLLDSSSRTRTTTIFHIGYYRKMKRSPLKSSRHDSIIRVGCSAVYKWILLVTLSLALVNVVIYQYIKSYHTVGSPNGDWWSRDLLQNQSTKITMFLEKTKKMGISVFLIEPEVQMLTSKIFTFGVDGSKWKDKIYFNETDGESDFKVIPCNQTAIIPASTENKLTDIPCHIFVNFNSSITYHVIVFYIRGENFVWSDKVNIRNVAMPSWLYLDGLQFGEFPVSFKSLETENTRMGDVVVPVGKYVRNFKKNRFIECDYARANLYLKQYNISRSSTFSAKAIRLLESTANLLEKIGVTFWLSSGTLLGWYRECGIIQHTNDLDIEINITDYTESIKEGFKKHKFSLANTFGKINDSFEYQMTRDGLRIDVFFVYEDKDNYWVGGTDGKSKLRFLLPKFTLCWTELLGLRVRVPCETDAYIRKSYGENWNKPKKSWNWVSDASNVKKAGRWD